MCVALTEECGSVWLSGLLVGVEVQVEEWVEVLEVEAAVVEGLQWPSLPALGRRQGQGGGSSAGLSTHERMLCGWVRTTAKTLHSLTQPPTHNMHDAWLVGYTVSDTQRCLKRLKLKPRHHKFRYKQALKADGWIDGIWWWSN